MSLMERSAMGTSAAASDAMSVSGAKALALGDVAELAHGRSRLYFRLGSFHEEYLGVLCFYELFQHFNEPRDICAGNQSSPRAPSLLLSTTTPFVPM